MNQLRLKSDPTIGKSVEEELSGINVSSLENGANILSDGDFVPGLGNVILNISGQVSMVAIPRESWEY